MDIIKTLTEEFSLKPFQVENTVKLIDDGNTIPFIARYRKEATLIPYLGLSSLLPPFVIVALLSVRVFVFGS